MKHFKIIFRIKEFDNITKFRLINSFLVSVGMGLLAPVLAILKGTLLPAWAISMFGIFNTISVKTNEYFSKKPLKELYKGGVFLHMLFVLTALLYFVNPFLMIVIDSTLVIVEVAVFSAYGIILNNHISQNYPMSMVDFQIVRNGIWADGTLIGLGASAIITTLLGLSGMVISFIIFNSLFSIWMLKNWRFYDYYNEHAVKGDSNEEK